MNKVLARWNWLDPGAAAREALPCCGSQAWAAALAGRRPITDEASLIEASTSIWQGLPEEAWQEAFDSHPRIGQSHAQAHTTEQSMRWSAREQRKALSQNDTSKLALEEANRRYEQKFGRIFIVCATGKTSAEIHVTKADRAHAILAVVAMAVPRPAGPMCAARGHTRHAGALS